jgi:predicted dithiol-disulfide oxidoreductase (DUF899 family)
MDCENDPNRTSKSCYTLLSDKFILLSRGDGDSVFHTYLTNGRCVEALGSVSTFLDLAPFGRQEDWEDSPEGWPQTAP